MGNPPLLILDEPTVGLDPNQIVETRSLIKQLGKKHTVLLSTHILSEVQSVCDRVVVLNNGKIVADSTVEELSDNLTGGSRLIVTVEGAQQTVQRVLSAIPGVRKASCVETRGGECEFALEVMQGRDIRHEIWERLSQNRLPMLGLRTCEMSLEDIFIALTK